VNRPAKRERFIVKSSCPGSKRSAPPFFRQSHQAPERDRLAPDSPRARRAKINGRKLLRPNHRSAGRAACVLRASFV